MSSRLTALVLLLGAIAGGFALEATDDVADDRVVAEAPEVQAGVATPAVPAAGSLSSTWFCAGGTASEGGIANHTIILGNPSDADRTAHLTVLTGAVAPAPQVDAGAGGETTTTEAPASTTTTEARPPEEVDVEVPARSRVSYDLRELVEAPLAGAVVEVDGGQVAVEHSITGELGRSTAPCSTTASTSWSFAWGVTAREVRELLVFMNPFPDDATVDVTFATDEGVRETGRFQGFVVPGRSVVGAYVDEDVTRKAQVSAQVEVLGGRLIVDRIQTFRGTDEDARRGITLGLGAPTPAEVWMFPEGYLDEGITEQVVVFNPTEGVAEVEVEVRLAPPQGDDPDAGFVPEPFSLSIQPGRYSVVDLPDPAVPDRVPTERGHSLVVRSLNSVPVVAERVMAAVEGGDREIDRLGVGATLGAPMGSPQWYFPGGGTSENRDEWIVLLNVSNDEPVTFSIASPTQGRLHPVEGWQDATLGPGQRAAVRLGDHIRRDDLPILVTADGPIVAERGLYAVGARGISQSMGIPFAAGAVVPEPITP